MRVQLYRIEGCVAQFSSSKLISFSRANRGKGPQNPCKLARYQVTYPYIHTLLHHSAAKAPHFPGLSSINQRTPPMASSSAAAFQGTSCAQLESWLKSNGINTSLYGKEAVKSIQMLFQEIEEGETTLTLSNDGSPLRSVAVLNALIQDSQGRTLIEEAQTLASGARRIRQLPLSEKMLPGETLRDSVVRAIKEELGTLLLSDPAAAISIDDDSYQVIEENKESMSYPGLKSVYKCHRVKVKVRGLPEGDFQTEEARLDGMLIHEWVWRKM